MDNCTELYKITRNPPRGQDAGSLINEHTAKYPEMTALHRLMVEKGHLEERPNLLVDLLVDLACEGANLEVLIRALESGADPHAPFSENNPSEYDLGIEILLGDSVGYE